MRGENGEIDYKRLYEQTLTENERLKDKLRKTEEELRDTKQTLEKINLVVNKVAYVTDVISYLYICVTDQ